MNSRKGQFSDVLDPFEIADDTFELDLVSGKISPGVALDADRKQKAQDTIDRLGLDGRECREVPARWFTEYLNHDISPQHLKRRFPFVWREVERQKLFRKERPEAPVS